MSRGLGKTQRAVLAAVDSLNEKRWFSGRFRADESPRLYSRVGTAKIIQEVAGFTNEDVRSRRGPDGFNYRVTRRGVRPSGYQNWVDDCYSIELAIRSGCVTRPEVTAIKRALATLVRRGLLLKSGVIKDGDAYTTPAEGQRWTQANGIQLQPGGETNNTYAEAHIAAINAIEVELAV